ncbi:cellulase family glycosylhydrolase [Isoptericola sp. b490]|uniref:glycoside hydrolase family 5 protein n=1 Tax=Actinotalea lenta TaxID=3064654 RepID=UPI002713F79C|nr:cellulase family glycosylhydrolase [Isoptericola sp. b490]MDO8121279.1 cellulase family glycosylhydrolase [Isoptericola sp. b490]
MRRILAGLGIGAGALLLVVVVLAVLGVGGRLTLAVEHTDAFASTVELPAPDVQGARLVAGDAGLVLRGVMIRDPYVLEQDGELGPDLFADIAATGANVVRIPVHPQWWREDDEYLWRYLEPAVRWAGDAGLYAIVDWHSIGNVRTGTAPHDPELYSHTWDLTVDFWTTVARFFAPAPHVLFEVFNEPQGINAVDWHDAADELVATIRATGATQPVVIGGVDDARDLSWVTDTPVDDGDVVYATHIYPGHARSGWDRWFGDVSADHPVLVTEWGFTDLDSAQGDSYLVGSPQGYGTELADYTSARGIGWVACWWDDDWRPAMLGPDGPTQWGRFALGLLSLG